jgi:hypothetical protein
LGRFAILLFSKIFPEAFYAFKSEVKAQTTGLFLLAETPITRYTKKKIYGGCMKIFILLSGLILFPASTHCQELQWFGPRAGIGILSNSGDSYLKSGAHSAFGWQLEFPYTNGNFTGYGEAGFMLLGIEQGKIFPHGWGYFGCRYKEIGAGLGPVVNPIGAGLGFNIYYGIPLNKLKVPVGIDCNIMGDVTRFQFFAGFNYK